MTASPLDDIRDLLNRLPTIDPGLAEISRRNVAQAGLDAGGHAAGMVSWLASASEKPKPVIRKPLVAIFAASHGIAAHGVSVTTTADIQDLVQLCGSGQSPINRLCEQFDLALKVFDLALDLPTADFTTAPALDERSCAATIAYGMEALAEGTDALCIGSFGAAGEVAAAAVLMALEGGAIGDWLGPVNPAIDARRHSVVQKALAHHAGDLEPIDAMSRLGGREMAAIAGAIIAARFQHVPVVLDGLTATVAASILDKASPGSVSHCRLAAPPAMAPVSNLVHAIGLDVVLGHRAEANTQEPLDGAFAMAMLRGVASLVP